MTITIAALVLMTTIPAAAAASNGSAQPLASDNARPAATGQSDADAIRHRVKEGEKVRVTDEQGQEWHGQIRALAPDRLVLFTREQQRDIPYATIVRIDRPHDGLGNGALIGLGSGAALGLLAVISEESRDCEYEGFFDCGNPGGAAYVAAPLLIGGLGAAIGVGVDALIKRDPNLFRRSGASRVNVAPTVARGVRGVTVSLRW